MTIISSVIPDVGGGIFLNATISSLADDLRLLLAATTTPLQGFSTSTPGNFSAVQPELFCDILEAVDRYYRFHWEVLQYQSTATLRTGAEINLQLISDISAWTDGNFSSVRKRTKNATLHVYNRPFLNHSARRQALRRCLTCMPLLYIWKAHFRVVEAFDVKTFQGGIHQQPF